MCLTSFPFEFTWTWKHTILKFGINNYELLGTIWKHKREKEGRMKRADFCFFWNLLAQKNYTCATKKTYFCFGTNRPFIKRHPCCQQHPNPPCFSFLPYLPICSQEFINIYIKSQNYIVPFHLHVVGKGNSKGS
jgi:hypothetical protein